MTATNERYKLNKELAQMLKGGVIMDAPSLIRRSASPRSFAPQTKGTLKLRLLIW